MTYPDGQAWPRDPGPGHWPQYGWGAPVPGPPPPPEPTRRRRVHPAIWIVAGIVVVAAVVGLLSAVLAGSDVKDAPGTGGRRLAIPATIPGYRAVVGANTDDLKANLGDQLARKGDDPEAVVRHAAVGVFHRGTSTERIVFVGVALRDIASLRGQVAEDGVRSSLRFFMSGATDDADAATAQDFPPGPRSGFLGCVSGTTSGTAVTICGWGDESAFALTIVAGRTSLTGAAAITRTLRSAIESD